jgi:rSAM/selenodomain-associated transferase 1
MRRHLILFVRAPQLGTGKRRLAQDIGDLAALRFERLMLARLLRRLGADKRWHLQIAVTSDKACHQIRHRHGQIKTIGQSRGDLGVRMLHALRACAPGPAVLVGADIPTLGARHIAVAFRLLGSHDLVFGPAKDGGFWLVGARHPQLLAHLFERVRWSSPHALADTLASLPLRLTVGFADRLEDVDAGEAYLRLAPTRGF